MYCQQQVAMLVYYVRVYLPGSIDAPVSTLAVFSQEISLSKTLTFVFSW